MHHCREMLKNPRLGDPEPYDLLNDILLAATLEPGSMRQPLATNQATTLSGSRLVLAVGDATTLIQQHSGTGREALNVCCVSRELHKHELRLARQFCRL